MNQLFARLSEFSMSGVVSPSVIKTLRKKSAPELVELKLMFWESGSKGPVWTDAALPFRNALGFRYRPHNGCWEMIAFCWGCNRDLCAHIAAIGLEVEDQHQRLLEKWQRHAEAHARRGYGYRYSDLPELQDAEAAFEDWLRAEVRVLPSKGLPPSQRVADDDELIFLLTRGEGQHREVPRLLPAISRRLRTKSGRAKVTGGVLLSEARDLALMKYPSYVEYATWCGTNFQGMSSQSSNWSDLVVDAPGIAFLRGSPRGFR